MTQRPADRAWKLDESTESGLAVWILRPTSGSMDPPEELSTPPHTPGYDPPQPVRRKWGCRIYIVDEDDAENVENNDNEPSKDSDLPNSVSQTPDLNVVYKIWEQKEMQRESECRILSAVWFYDPRSQYKFWRQQTVTMVQHSVDLLLPLDIMNTPQKFCLGNDDDAFGRHWWRSGVRAGYYEFWGHVIDLWILERAPWLAPLRPQDTCGPFLKLCTLRPVKAFQILLRIL